MYDYTNQVIKNEESTGDFQDTSNPKIETIIPSLPYKKASTNK